MTAMFKTVPVEEESWRLDAACIDHPNPRIFLYASQGRPTPDPLVPTPQERAKAICDECPVKTQCLMSGEKELGIRGGLPYNQRQKYFANLRRERRAIDKAARD